MNKNATLRRGLEAATEALRARGRVLSSSLWVCDRKAADPDSASDERSQAESKGDRVAAALRANTDRILILEDAIAVLEELASEAAGN